MLQTLILILPTQVWIQKGGQGVWTPPAKSQVIWVSIGNKQLDPPPPLEKVGPPPPPWKMLDPLWNLENDRFLWNWPFDFCKISWGLKKKNNIVRLTWTPPWRKFLDPRMKRPSEQMLSRRKYELHGWKFNISIILNLIILIFKLAVMYTKL